MTCPAFIQIFQCCKRRIVLRAVSATDRALAAAATVVTCPHGKQKVGFNAVAAQHQTAYLHALDTQSDAVCCVDTGS
jgi:hypothetical protein